MPNSQLDTPRSDGLELDAIEADDEEMIEDEVEAELEALFALGQVHTEVAVAYEIVAQDVSAGAVHDKLLAFARDHRRQLEAIAGYLRAQGVEPAAPMPPPESSAFVTLADALSAIAPEAGLRALAASEQFACASYAALLELTPDSPQRTLIERALGDERRRARWLDESASAELSSTEDGEQ